MSVKNRQLNPRQTNRPATNFSGGFHRLAALAAVILCAAPSLAAKRPDIVVFLSDDHTWRDSAVYGSLDIKTPNMARLAAAGMAFGNAFVASPSCAPSRAALLTGRYPANNGAEANHSRPRADIRKLPADLQALGYEVASFGKVGHYAQTPEYGFDVARHYGYHEDIAVSKAVEWLRRRESDRPLCLFVGTNWPHVPWPEDTGDIDPAQLKIPPNHVDTPISRKWRAKYVAAVRQMDKELGQVYDAAREKLGADTFFLHTSDHGAQWPFGKWCLYEDSIRTPLIVSWPGRIAKGARTDAMVSWIDILPTLVDVAGGQAPGDIDGRSFLPVLAGKTRTHRDVIFTTHSGDGNFNVYPIRAARTSDGWKYIRNLHPEFRFTSHVTAQHPDGGYWPSWLDQAVSNPDARRKVRNYQERPAEEIYNLTADPYEQRNLIGDPAQAKRLAELRGKVDRWMKETADPQTVFGEPRRIAPAGRPNIITFFIDDMGWSDLSCFGGKTVTTENLDRLADEGLRFTNFYVNAPICSPSRVALTTGQYPQRWRITSYLDNRRRNNQRGMAQWLDPKAPVLARELQRAGYATGHFGKWHMGGQRDVGNAPLITKYGFDRSLTNFEGLGPRVLPLKDAYDGKPPKKHDLGSANLGYGPIRWEDRSVVTAAFVEDALTFIDRAQATGQPFYLNLWPDDVHSPFFPPEVLRNATDGSKRALYYAVLDAMDRQLGALIDRVRNDGKLKNNTLIVVASDNGHEEGAGSSAPLRGAKTWLYEGGVRSPLIVWGPGLLAEKAAGATNDESIFCALDLNASLYAIAGTEPPQGVTLDGENLADTLLGKSKQGRKAPIFWRRPPDRPGTKDEPNPDLAARDGKWKFHVNYDGSRPRLYDLDADISESRDIATEHPQVVARLKQAVFAWNAELPIDAGDPAFGQNEKTGSLPPNQFVNPIAEGADPWVVRDPNAARYLWCFSEGNRAIAIHASDRLTALGPKHIVWRAPAAGPVSRQVWAPELHFLDGRWHVYFAASDGQNENHLTYVLRSATADPLGPYKLHGPFATGNGADGRSPNIWAIDMTVLERESKRYAVWSGWDAPGTDRQYLYLAPLKSPTELGGPRVRLCANDDHLWERTEPKADARGLNEAPQLLQAGDRTFLIYSCGASWLPTYKLGLLELTGRDPLDPDAWVKQNPPLFAGTDQTYGVGHSCFVRSPDDSQWWHIYHAKRDRQPGWRRAIHVQPMRIGPLGFPLLGQPVAPGQPLERPAGERSPSADAPHQEPLRGGALPAGWSYYGHHQFIKPSDKGLALGCVPADPVNDYRCGEKLLLERAVPAELSVEVTIDFLGNAAARDAGILFRVSGASVGYDAQRGYFAGLIPKTQIVILGKTDGASWTELGRAAANIDPAQPQRLRIDVVQDRITVSLNGKRALTASDRTYRAGRVGLRVIDTHARFADFRVSSSPSTP